MEKHFNFDLEPSLRLILQQRRWSQQVPDWFQDRSKRHGAFELPIQKVPSSQRQEQDKITIHLSSSSEPKKLNLQAKLLYLISFLQNWEDIWVHEQTLQVELLPNVALNLWEPTEEVWQFGHLQKTCAQENIKAQPNAARSYGRLWQEWQIWALYGTAWRIATSYDQLEYFEEDTGNIGQDRRQQYHRRSTFRRSWIASHWHGV